MRPQVGGAALNQIDRARPERPGEAQRPQPGAPLVVEESDSGGYHVSAIEVAGEEAFVVSDLPRPQHRKLGSRLLAPLLRELSG